MKKLLQIIFLQFFIFLSFGQELSNEDVKIVLQKIANNYTSNHYAMTFTKKIYRSIEDAEPYEVTIGTFRFGENMQYRLEEPGMLVIQNDRLNLAIDSSDNKIYASSPEKEIVPIQLANFESDSLFKELIFTLKKGKTSYVLKVENRNELSNHYTLELDPKSYRVLRFEYHFEQANYFSEELGDESVERPYMIIEYTSYVNEKQAYSYFDPVQYISSYTLPLTLNPTIQGFEIRDSRPESYK